MAGGASETFGHRLGAPARYAGGPAELAPRHSGSGEPSDIGESFAIQIRTSHYHITSAFRMLRPNASTLEAALKLARGRSQTGGGALRHSQRQPESARSTPTADRRVRTDRRRRRGACRARDNVRAGARLRAGR